MDQTWLLFEHKFVTLGLQILGGAFSPLVPYLEGIGVVVGGFLSHFSVVGISLSSRFFFFVFFFPVWIQEVCSMRFRKDWEVGSWRVCGNRVRGTLRDRG